ncbi:MAG: hypothetical protein QHI48_02965 [Bacteroidota bacterium]|nr:hypothetical protein [Bacteroidota bacterium]
MKALPFFAALILCEHCLFAQCACTAGAAVGGLTPVGGTVNVGVLREGYGRASLTYRYAAGRTTLRGDERTGNESIRSYGTHYTTLQLAYGLTDVWTLETGVGYFPRKVQDFGYTKATGSGASHIYAGTKYNVFSRPSREAEVTLGAGINFPLGSGDSSVPQHILPSSGAYGLVLQGFLHKGWKRAGFRVILLHRSEFNAENNIAYRYGAGHFTSIIAGKYIGGPLTAFLELRHEFRMPDMYLGNRLENTGCTVFTISPQINAVFGQFNLSALFDYPVYRYYKGTQLANDFSAAVVLTWQADLRGE